MSSSQILGISSGTKHNDVDTKEMINRMTSSIKGISVIFEILVSISLSRHFSVNNLTMSRMESKPCYVQGKNPQRRIEPTTLHQAGQQAQHTTNELFRPLTSNMSRALGLVCWGDGCQMHVLTFLRSASLAWF